jgi:aminopeptidase N
MPSSSSVKFAATFARALAQGGQLTPDAVRRLKKAQAAIRDTKERAAAESLLAMVRDDHKLDSFEVEPARVALGVLSGVTEGPLPPDLERALSHAVPQANVQVKHYDLTFDLSVRGSHFPAHAVITLDKPVNGDAILEADPDRLTIEEVRAGDKKVPFEVKAGRLHVQAGSATTLDIRYTVKPDEKVSPNAYGLIRDKYNGRMWTMTWPEHTGSLFPSNSAPADGSTTRVTVRVAKGFSAVGSGTATGRGTFETNEEVPAYANAFYVAKDFVVGEASHKADGVTVSSYGDANEIPEKNRAAYRETARDALEFYSKWLGKFDYGPTLKLIELKGGLGGMEHTAAVAIMLNAAHDINDAKETAAHETAHHWFGDNLRIKTWGDFWMSEGFTNYATYRYFRSVGGDAQYFSLLDRGKADLTDSLKSNPHALVAPAYTDVNEIFDSVPYEMGPWMLRMMEVQLGTPKFDALLRDWYQSHQQQAVSTDEFVAYAKQKTGHDFAPFFATWNKITAVPTFKADLKVNASTVDVSLAAQTAVPDGLKVPLVLADDNGKSKTVLVDPSKPLHVDAGFAVTKYAWDPEHTVLATVK